MRKEKKREKEKKNDKVKVIPRSTWGNREGIVYESESFWISTQKHDKVTKWISSRVPIPIVSCTFMKYVSSCLNRIGPARTFEIIIREKS